MTTTYLLDPATGQTAQDTPANAANMPGATPIANGSDNVLLDAFLDPALGCKPFEAPDLSNGGTPAPRRPWTSCRRPGARAGRSPSSRRTTR